MHSPITIPGTDLTLTPVPSLLDRVWVVTDQDGRVLGRVRRHRENPGTRRERVRWDATTPTYEYPDTPFITRREAVAFLTERHTP